MIFLRLFYIAVWSWYFCTLLFHGYERDGQDNGEAQVCRNFSCFLDNIASSPSKDRSWR